MISWKIRFKILSNKIINVFRYNFFRIKSIFGLKTLGFREHDGLILMTLLRKNRLPIFHMNIKSVSDDLDSVDLDYLHEKGYRFNNKEYLSIIFNSSSRQVRVVVGESMTPFIDNMVKNQIQKKMQGYVSKNEIIKGLEIGMKEIRRIITQNNDN